MLKLAKHVFGLVMLILVSFTLVNCASSTSTPLNGFVSPTEQVIYTEIFQGSPSPIVRESSPQPSPTETVFPTLPKPTRTTLPLTPMWTPLSFSSLQAGEYLVYYYSSDNGRKDYMGITSVNGNIRGIITDDIADPSTVFSPDLKYLPFVHYDASPLDPYWWNTHDNSYWPALTLKYCSRPNWSSDSQKLIVSCNDEIRAGNSLYLTSPFTDTLLLLMDCYQTRDICTFPNWSPDGKWIIYSQRPAYSGGSPSSGMYLINTVCYPDADQCNQEKQGPYDVFPPFAWSPDSTQLATFARDGNTIIIYQVLDDEIHPIRQVDLGENIFVLLDSLLWSPDGKRLAFNSRDDVYILSLDDEKLDYLFSADYIHLSNWLVIP